MLLIPSLLRCSLPLPELAVVDRADVAYVVAGCHCQVLNLVLFCLDVALVLEIVEVI